MFQFGHMFFLRLCDLYADVSVYHCNRCFHCWKHISLRVFFFLLTPMQSELRMCMMLTSKTVTTMCASTDVLCVLNICSIYYPQSLTADNVFYPAVTVECWLPILTRAQNCQLWCSHQRVLLHSPPSCRYLQLHRVSVMPLDACAKIYLQIHPFVLFRLQQQMHQLEKISQFGLKIKQDNWICKIHYPLF